MRRLYQTTQAQEWALHELQSGTLSAATHTRTLRSLERAVLVRWQDDEWTLTRAGEREAVRATERLARRTPRVAA